MLKLVHARTSLEAGDLGAGEESVGTLAVVATRLTYTRARLFDDFTSVFRLATDIAWEAHDRAALDQILAIVDADSGNRHPNGLRAQENRIRGLLAIEDSEEPPVVESHFRAAIDAARQWCSPVALSRAQADLGVWLDRQGRPDEGAELVAEARETFGRLGAVRWLEQLDARLAGVPT